MWNAVTFQKFLEVGHDCKGFFGLATRVEDDQSHSLVPPRMFFSCNLSPGGATYTGGNAQSNDERLSPARPIHVHR